MGYRIVRVSREIFREMFTEGRSFPNAANERLRITAGLPEGAQLEGIGEGRSLLINDDIVMRFSHPSWPDVPEGHAYPEQRVEFTMEATVEFRPWSFDKLTPEDVEELRAKLAVPPARR